MATNSTCRQGTNVWVASVGAVGGGTLTPLNPAGANATKPSSSAQPVALALVQRYLYFVDISSPYLERVDTTAGAVTIVSPVGAAPDGLLFDGTNLLVSSGDNSVSRLTERPLLGTYSVGNGPATLAFGGSNFWGANLGDGTVTKLRASDGSKLGTLTTGLQPSGIAFDGSSVWVTNWGSNTVSRLRTSDGYALGTSGTGIAPAGVVFGGSHIWVTNSGSRAVSRF